MLSGTAAKIDDNISKDKTTVTGTDWQAGKKIATAQGTIRQPDWIIITDQQGSYNTYRHKIRVRGKNIAIKAQSAIETFNVPLDIEEKRINVGAENKIIK